MTTTAIINMFGKKLHTESCGQPENVIPSIIKPMKKDIDKKIKEDNLTKAEATILTIEMWTPNEGERFGYIAYKGSRYGNSADYKYKVTDNCIEIENTWYGKRIVYTWNAIENLTKEDIKRKKKELIPE